MNKLHDAKKKRFFLLAPSTNGQDSTNIVEKYSNERRDQRKYTKSNIIETFHEIIRPFACFIVYDNSPKVKI